jgi:hypothetical protein
MLNISLGEMNAFEAIWRLHMKGINEDRTSTISFRQTTRDRLGGLICSITRERE